MCGKPQTNQRILVERYTLMKNTVRIAAALVLLCAGSAFAQVPPTLDNTGTGNVASGNVFGNNNTATSTSTSTTTVNGLGSGNGAVIQGGAAQSSSVAQGGVAQGGTGGDAKAVAEGGKGGSAVNNGVTQTGSNFTSPRLAMTAIAGYGQTTASCRFTDGAGLQLLIAGGSFGKSRKDDDCAKLELVKFFCESNAPLAAQSVACDISFVKKTLGDNCGQALEDMCVVPDVVAVPTGDFVTHKEMIDIEQRQLVKQLSK
jgi:hypothetical protein